MVSSSIGDPEAVESTVTLLSRASDSFEEAHGLARSARPSVWSGAAEEAYTEASQHALKEALAVADTLYEGSAILARYASAQRHAEAEYARAQATVDQAHEALRANPLDVPQALALVRAEVAGFAVMGQLQEAAATAADELKLAIGVDRGDRPWWDPFGWFNDPQEPDERVSDDILDDEAFDPDDVSQGSIGDCFMLSTVVALLNTDEGDQFIRDNIRWDEEADGYWVTLYDDGEPHEVLVEHVFDNGARRHVDGWWIFDSNEPSIAALYESAIMQEEGYDYLEGGVPADAMALITGEEVETIENNGYQGLSPNQTEELQEVMNDGGQVVISSPRSGEHELTVTGPDGSTREIELVTQHSYVVTRIEPDGSMWMQNPWGPGNSADGGGEFLVSAEDIDRLFWRAASTNVSD